MSWEITGSGWATLTWAADDKVLKMNWLPDEPHAHVFVFTGAAHYVYVQILVLPDEYAETAYQKAWRGMVFPGRELAMLRAETPNPR